jgi:hypothetical protein
MTTMIVKDGSGATKHIGGSGSGSAADPFYPAHGSSSNGPVKTRIDRYLDLNGTGSGTKNMNQNYSVTSDIVFIQPTAGQIMRIERMLVYIQDTGTFDSGGYGNGTALTTGITVRLNGDGGVQDLTDGVPIKTNGHWARLCYDADHNGYGTGDEYLAVRWTFSKAGAPLRLDGDTNDRLEIVLNDDFSGLTEHYFLVQGVYE